MALLLLLMLLGLDTVTEISVLAKSCRPTVSGGYICSDGSSGMSDGMGGYYNSPGGRNRFEGGTYHNRDGSISLPDPSKKDEFSCRFDGFGGFECDGHEGS